MGNDVIFVDFRTGLRMSREAWLAHGSGRLQLFSGGSGEFVQGGDLSLSDSRPSCGWNAVTALPSVCIVGVFAERPSKSSRSTSVTDDVGKGPHANIV